MSKYTFVVETVISMHVNVDAGSLAEAVEKAQSSAVQGLCWQCARGDEGDWCTSGELDGDPASGKLVMATVDGDELDVEEIDW